jgi:hypothetical protein
MAARTPRHHLPGLAARKLVHGGLREAPRGLDVPGAHLYDAAAMGRPAHRPIGGADDIHDIERQQRDVRRLEHVAAGVEHEIRPRFFPGGVLRAVGLLPQPRQQLIVELHARDMGHVARDLAETVDPHFALLPRFVCRARHGGPRQRQHKAGIDAVIAGLMHSPERRQALAHVRAASLPSPWRRMSTTPASTARGSASATPAASVIGQTSKHLPHCVQASAMAAMRADKADSNVRAGCSLMGTLEYSRTAYRDSGSGVAGQIRRGRLCARGRRP